MKTEKIKVLSMLLSHAQQHNDELMYEKVVIKSCVGEVNQFLQNLIDTHDSLLMISVRQHLADKLKPVFSMLNYIEGVSESRSLLK